MNELLKEMIKINNLGCKIYFNSESGEIKTEGSKIGLMSGLMTIMDSLLEQKIINIEDLKYILNDKIMSGGNK